MSPPLRSRRWFAGRDVPGFLHRTALRAEGLSSLRDVYKRQT